MASPTPSAAPSPTPHLVVKQPRQGYRFSLDAMVLAAHAAPRPGERILELGTGCGIVALLIARENPGNPIVAVEVQPELARFARKNVADNGKADRISILCQDMRLLKPGPLGGPFELIVSNPPYRSPGSGRINPRGQRAVARHEIAVTLAQWVDTAKRLLAPGGRLVVVYTSARLEELLTRLAREQLTPKWLRFVHATAEAEAKLVLVGTRKGGRPALQVRPPLIIYSAPGTHSPEAAAILDPLPETTA